MDLYELDKYRGKRIHFIAIGGCSMSGLAMILNNLGFCVTGSDKNESVFTDNLRRSKISLTIGHFPENIDGAGLVIYNAAIKAGNPEFDRAVKLNIPMMDRATLLGLISDEYARVACVSGCHGKTTITSMAALMLILGNTRPIVHVGGMVNFLGGGVHIGDSDIFLTEACEYVGSFLKLSPKYIVLNNIDDDHLDYFKTFDNILSTFRAFVEKLPIDGVLIACTDDENVYELAKNCDKQVYTYSLNGNSDLYAKNISYDYMGNPSYDLYIFGEKKISVSLNILGEHNIQNSLAAIALCHLIFKVDLETCRKALLEYSLAGRRFELLGITKNGYRVVHDYAHHPTEIDAALKAISKYPHRKLWAIFQCNSYSRARSLKTKYGKCFSFADTVIVPDIFPGRDTDMGDIYAPDLVNEIKSNGADAIHIPTFEEIHEFLQENAKADDIVLTIGSGSVYVESRKLLF